MLLWTYLQGGYTPLHLAAIQGHEGIIELLTKTYYADANIRDYSGKKAKQYLSNSASSRAQRDSLVLNRSKSVPFDKSDYLEKTELLVSSKLSSKSGNEKSDNGFMRNSGSRRSNRESAIKSLIRASTGAMKQTVMRSGWGSSEDVINEKTPKSSPRNSAEPSPVIHRRKGSFKDRDRDLMPPPGASSRHSHKSNKPQHSVSKESLHTEDKKLSMMKQVPRSESEPNLGEIVQPSRSTFI
ncbi:uncharacterized protein LOC123548589 isoform X2 [Mercenaria mercenaria]|uniref:uncharacterized protein LOC123548589 isoform X2 n=1 Tax=Mercenaria mercenaria TaxID=6596 RepID=UPI00234E4BD8|nr:uncharacterized protein LOC123548589 isoform X2 [Mercenaria mercenaria]